MALHDILGGGGLQGVVNDVTGKTGNGTDFTKVLTEADLLADGTSLPTGEFAKAGTFVVPAQEQYRWGAGAAKHSDNQGYLYVDIGEADDGDTGTEKQQVEGMLRVQQRDAQERNIVTVTEQRTDVLRGSKTDRQQKEAFPEQTSYPKVGRDSKLNLSINADIARTISVADSTVLAPVTVYPQ